MFYPLSLYIGLRYTRAKRRNHFISFISLTSMLGIALGVTVLITVLSVMNGFDEVIHERFFSLASQITIRGASGSIEPWQEMTQKLADYPGVLAVSPYVEGRGILTPRYGDVNPVAVWGVDPQAEAKVSKLPQLMVAGSLNDLKAGGYGIIVGQELAGNMGLMLGDKIMLVTAEASLTPVGVLPRSKRFTVVGIFHAGKGFGFDTSMAFIHLKDAQTLFKMGDNVNAIQLKVYDLYAAAKIARGIAAQLTQDYTISNWTDEYGQFFQAVQLEKTMMFLMLMLIVAVAAFNLVSTLVMVVNDKQADIAILRTLGAVPRTIMSIFMVQGVVVGFVGTLLGLGGGILLASNATALVSALQNAFHVQLLSSNVYYVNYLPSKLDWNDVWQVCVAALMMSLIATLYPAWRASRTQPAEALRYE